MPLLYIPDVDAIREIDEIYTDACVGTDSSIIRDLNILISKGYDLNVFTKDETINWRAITPLTLALLSRNENAVRIFSNHIKQNFKKLGELLTHSSDDELPLTTAIKQGHIDNINHLLNAGNPMLATLNDVQGPPCSVAVTTIPMYALIHYGQWEGSENIQELLKKFYEIKDETEAELYPVTIPPGEYVVHWDCSDSSLKAIFKHNGDPNVPAPGGKSVTDLFKDILKYAADPKVGFKSDYSEAELTFHSKESTQDKLVFSQYILNPFKQKSPATVKVVMDISKVRKLVMERNIELAQIKKDQELFSSHQTSVEVQALYAKLQALQSQLKERGEEQVDMLSYMEGDVQITKAATVTTREEIKKAAEKVTNLEVKVDEESKLVDEQLGIKIEKQIKALTANNPKLANYLDFVGRHLKDLMNAWSILSTKTVQRTNNTATDFVASGFSSLAKVIPAPFNLAFSVLGGVTGKKADKEVQEKMNAIAELLPQKKSPLVYGRQLAFIVVLAVRDQLNRLSPNVLESFSDESLKELSHLTLGIIAHAMYNAKEFHINSQLPPEDRERQFTNGILKKVDGEHLLIQTLERLAKKTSPTNSPITAAKKPDVSTPDVIFSLDFKKGQQAAAVSAEKKKDLIGNIKETLKEKVHSATLRSYS